MMSQGTFTDRLWKGILPIYRKILDEPFVRGLADGSLPRGSFAHYLSQDILYVKDNALALEKLAARSRNPEEKEFFFNLATEGYNMEREMHRDFLTHFQIREAEEKSPAINAYSSFLLDHAGNSPYPVAAAALLPCFWVYGMVGKEIAAMAAEDNPYLTWITTYESTEFEAQVDRFLDIAESLGMEAEQQTRKEMEAAFIAGTRLELGFFQEAWLEEL